MWDTKVLDLGGSLVAPDAVAVEFLKNFKRLIEEYLEGDQSRRLVMVIGGGSPARNYQEAYRSISSAPNDDEADWIGIAATRLNARLIKALFEDFCADEVVTNPTEVGPFTGRILVASGWKPGFSTDYDAVLLAEKFDAKVLISLTNIAKIHTADPKTDRTAKPLDTISWSEFEKIAGSEWIPGKNTPFDPMAVTKATEMKLIVISALGTDLDNLRRILCGEEFVGTTVGPE
jgi:uridylate kinase